MAHTSGAHSVGRLLATLLGVTVLVTTAGPPAPTRAQPLPPATFYGTASIDGSPAPAGARVMAFVGGIDCTESGSGEVVYQGDTAVYVLAVLHGSQREGCANPGDEVTFEIDGQPVAQAGAWELAAIELNLNAGEGDPLPIPDSFATTQAGGVTSGVTATPDEADGGDGSSLPWGRLGIAALAVAGLGAAVGGAILRARARSRSVTGA